MAYPNTLLTITNPTSANFLDDAGVIHDVQHSTINDEVEAIEAELGLLPKGSYASVRARLDDVLQLTGTQTVSGSKTFSAATTFFGPQSNQAIQISGGAQAHGIEVGRQDGTAGGAFIDFHVGATAVDYDWRLIGNVGSGTGTIGQGTATVYGQQTLFLATMPGTAPLAVRGATSQTANLQEWYNSTPTLVAAVHPDGTVRTPAVVDLAGTGPYISMGSTATILFNRTTVGNVPFRIRGMAGQTGALQRWEDSTSAPQAIMGTVGDLYLNNVQNVAGTGPYVAYNTTGIIVTNRTTVAAVPLQVRAMAGQTGDLQLWQDSGAVEVASIDVNGGFTSRAPNGIRLTNSPTVGYGVIYRMDNTNMYTLITANNDPEGTWNALRPFYIALSTGRVNMENGLTVLGTATVGGQAVVVTNDARLATGEDAKILTLMGVI